MRLTEIYFRSVTKSTRFFRWHATRSLPIAEAKVGDERKDVGGRGLVASRVEEMKRLEAAERALVDAFCEHARTAADGGRLL
ncbi:MAG: hypothetical protein ACXVCV_06705, partial [Polyangia bacterium]